jgi:hypothetical protein
MRRHPVRTPARSVLPALVLACLASRGASAQTTHPGPPITIQRANGDITLDGELNDPGWQGITPITQWYETRVGDSVEPQVKNVGWLAYDDRYLYAAFQFDDPHPELIRAPIAAHDQLSGTSDYGGVIVDSNDDGKSAILFLANPNGLEYDALSNDASGEDSSPDYYWESRGKITKTGWTLEMRIPFTSLRYSRAPAQSWGIMLYRNYPRDQHYQFFSAKMPRDVNCFICNESPMSGLVDLPHSEHLVVAPYTSAQRTDTPLAGPGTPMVDGPAKSEAGADVKWSPLASLAIDATIHPDFSQVESDAAQITANERFALSYAEKRSFFLEGIDLFATPLQAVYTRSITTPNSGGRITGRLGSNSYTALYAHDLGQGLVILPGAEGSGIALQDFASDVGIAHVRHDMGLSSIGLLATGRSISTDGGGHNAVFGPDLRWQPGPRDVITAQALWSDSRTPNRPDLATEWDGRTLQDDAMLAGWSHNTKTSDLYVQGQQLGDDFRADEGFITQVGFREAYFQGGYTLRPAHAIVTRERFFSTDYYDEDVHGHPLNRRVSVGTGMDGRFNSFFRVEFNRDDIKVGSHMFTRFRPYTLLQMSPSSTIQNVSLEGYFNDEIDFDNARLGKGTTLIGSVSIHPGDHLELAPLVRRRWLNVDDPALGSGRLFLAQVERLRATYSFSARTFVRLISQYQRTTSNPALYTFAVSDKRARFDSSALFAYKLNWQTVTYLGYGDARALNNPDGKLVPGGRQVFAKVSYAIQK